MTLVALIQLVIFMAYVAFVQHRFGKLKSISQSTYRFSRRERILFVVFLSLIGFLNLLHGMGAYGFLTMAGLAFTGITLNHQSTGANTKYVHLVGVVGAIVSAFLGFIVLEGIWITTVLMAMSIPMLYLYDKEHVVWNAEIVAMLMIVLSYVIM